MSAAEDLSLVSAWLDTQSADTWCLNYHQTIRETMLKNWVLPEDFRTALETLDLTKKVFSPDLSYRHAMALIHQAKQLDTSACEWFVDLNQTISIQVIDPIFSGADHYFSKLDEFSQGGARFAVPVYNSLAVVDTSKKIRQALESLVTIQATGVHSALLNSIAIFAGNEETSTSGVVGAVLGRIYIREVIEPYPEFYYLDTLIHEVSHLYLNLIAVQYPLISDYTRHFFSVAKNRERPIFGIYHTIFVLYRLMTLYPLMESLLKRSEQAVSTDIRHEDYLYHRFVHIPFNYDFRLTLYRMKFNIACTQLLTSDALTPIGRAFLLGMQENILSQYEGKSS